jgi:hypothetical protein
MKRETIQHEFVDVIPERLEEGVLYISVRYATALHRCLCGCGSEIVTPLSPTDWELSFDGKTISLDPSIGNWSYECQSHYWIRRNGVHWSKRMSERQIARVRAQDRHEKEQLGKSQGWANSNPQKVDGGESGRVRAWTRKLFGNRT